MISRRIFLASLPAVLVPPVRLEAATEFEEDYVCLLCQTKFTAVLDGSGTTSGQRLDLKPLGSIRAPWRLPVCPKCRFVQYKEKEKFTKEELTALKQYVNSADYKAIPLPESSHFLLGKTYEHLKTPPREIAHVYLMASWQVEHDAKRHRAYLEQSLEQFNAFLASNPPKDEPWKVASFLGGEILRQLQLFNEAQRVFQSLKTQEQFADQPYARLITYELELIRKQDSGRHPIPRPEK
jgi:hypothetical protein